MKSAPSGKGSHISGAPFPRSKSIWLSTDSGLDSQHAHGPGGVYKSLIRNVRYDHQVVCNW